MTEIDDFVNSLSLISENLEKLKPQLERDQIIALENLLEEIGKLSNARDDLDPVSTVIAIAIFDVLLKKMFHYLENEDYENWDRGMKLITATVKELCNDRQDDLLP